MHYYTFSTLIFADGKLRDARNLLYKSDSPSTIIEFKKEVERHHAGLPDSYSGIVIPMWQEINEDTFNHIQKGFNEDFMNPE